MHGPFALGRKLPTCALRSEVARGADETRRKVEAPPKRLDGEKLYPDGCTLSADVKHRDLPKTQMVYTQRYNVGGGAGAEWQAGVSKLVGCTSWGARVKPPRTIINFALQLAKLCSRFII